MKLALAALLLFSALPADAKPGRYDRGNYESQPGYANQEKCYKKVYKEEYVPGTMSSPGYVRSYKEKVRVPCKQNSSIEKTHYQPYEWDPFHGDKGGWKRHPRPTYHEPVQHQPAHVDNNDCSGGTVAGGILGGGAAAAMSRGDGRWWAIPLGVVSGAMVGCQIDGG